MPFLVCGRNLEIEDKRPQANEMSVEYYLTASWNDGIQ